MADDETDRLLSLDDADWPERLARLRMAEALYTLALHGAARERPSLYARMSAPQPGDWVLETTHARMDRKSRTQAYGVLVGQEAARPGDPDTLVRFGPGPDDVVRWANARFVAIPQNGRQVREWMGMTW